MFSRIVIYGLLVIFAIIYLMPLFVMLVTSFKTMDEIQNGNMLALPKSPTHRSLVQGLGRGLRRPDLRRHQGLFLELDQDGRSGRCDLDDAGCAERLRADQMALSGPHAGLRPDAVCLLHSVPVGAPADGDHPWQPRPVRSDAAQRRSGIVSASAIRPSISSLVHVIYGLGFTTLFFRNYYEAFPTELVKAAQVDGAGFFQIFRRIMLPNSLPIIVVTVIYQFTNIWNDFLFASAYAGTGDSMPMTVALNNVVNTSTGVVEYNVNMAAAMIAALPTLLVYILAGRYFVRGLMAGAVKG